MVPSAVPAGTVASTFGQHGISRTEAAPPSPADASDRRTLAPQVAAAHQEWCRWVFGSGPSSLRRRPIPQGS
ncbi:hypothetical protein, partial [Actinocorallia glomerata]